MIFFFNDTATTETYTLSLHDALPISGLAVGRRRPVLELHLLFVRAQRHRAREPSAREGDVRRLAGRGRRRQGGLVGADVDRKSTRLNSSHANISYAVFCLKKNKQDYR